MKRPSVMTAGGAAAVAVIAAIAVDGLTTAPELPQIVGRQAVYAAARYDSQARTRAPMLSGPLGADPRNPHPGDLFNTSNGTWSGSPTSYRYQWEQCDRNGSNCTNILGATTNSYTVVSGDLGHTLRAAVSACDSVGCAPFSSKSTSAATGVVTNAGSAPVNVTLPIITGDLIQGSVLTTTAGTWSGTPTSYTYQWERCTSTTSCADLTGATSSSYTLTSADAGNVIAVRVTATNAYGSTAATSDFTATVAALNTPANTAVPTISGTLTVGSQLSATNGVWTGPPTSYAYQWQRCNSTGGSCTDISGATAATYTLTTVDTNATIRIGVTATNTAGSATAYSAVTGPIQGTSSSSTTTTTTTTTTTGGQCNGTCGSGIAPSLPDGPPTPSGGWTVEYADAFGAANGTAPGQDNTYWPSRIPGQCTSVAPANSNELDRYYCNHVSVDSDGLELKCDLTGTTVATQPYQCGAIKAVGAYSGYKFFDYQVKVGTYWVFEIAVKLSPNYGANDQNFWSYGASTAYEYDFFENYGGWQGSKTATWCNSYTPWGVNAGTTPSSTAGLFDTCKSAKPTPFDPSQGYHVYDFYFFPGGGGTLTSFYIDGVLQAYDGFQFQNQGTGAQPTGCGVNQCTAIGPIAPTQVSNWQIQNTWRNKNYTSCSFSAQSSCPWTGTQTMSIRYVAFYENTTANGAGAINAGLAPGTNLR